MTYKPMKPADLEAAMKKLGYKNKNAHDGLDKEAFGAEFGVSYHAVRFWLTGKNPIPLYVEKFIILRMHLTKLNAQLKKKRSMQPRLGTT